MKSAVEYNAFIHRESRVEPHHSGFLLFFYFNGTVPALSAAMSQTAAAVVAAVAAAIAAAAADRK